MLAAVLLGPAIRAPAIERVSLEIAQISLPQGQASQASATLDLSSGTADVRIGAAQLQLSRQIGSYRNVAVHCPDWVTGAVMSCDGASLEARGGPLRRISGTVSGQYDPGSGALSLRIAGLEVAGGRAALALRARKGARDLADDWSCSIDAAHLDIAAARQLIAPWWSLPEGYSMAGGLALEGKVTRQGTALQLEATARTQNLSFSDPTGAIAGEKLGLTVAVTAISATTASPGASRFGDTPLSATLRLSGFSGQTLAGPVLLDLTANPLELRAKARLQQRHLQVRDLVLSQTHLAEMRGQADLVLAERPSIASAHLDVTRLEFPAAYRSLLQVSWATTPFGALETRGLAAAQLDLADDALERAELELDGLSFEDPKARLGASEVSGKVYWAQADATVPPSSLSWRSSRAYGLAGGPAQIAFVTHGADLELIGDTRLPILDGALVVHRFAARNLGAADAQLDFDAHLEPISMPLLSKAFGWPELSGQLAGRIPALSYRDRVLSTEGDLTANVFDGTITGSRFRLRDPLGPWPRLSADVTARRLDLDLVTHTFSIGSITGRLDADIQQLRLFDWSPVEFDARLYTTPGDRSRHRISQKAVGSISSIGGGGGGVVAALQSGVLRFFDHFRYDQIGIRCQLRDDVCLMSGIQPVADGYYLVKGAGLPRIDIIGNAGRVAWSQLVGQIAASVRSQNVVVR